MATPLPDHWATTDNAFSVPPPGARLTQMSPPTVSPAPAAPDRGWMLDLSVALQTTLDIPRLVAILAERVRPLVSWSGVAYAPEGAGQGVEIGSEGRHRVAYDLVVETRRLGTLALTKDVPFTPDEVATVENVVANFVYPLRNALMYREAVEAASRDPLTGVSNRQNLHAVLEREIDLARRHGTDLSVLMIDADRFKDVNDRHGHQCGDAVLVRLADCIRRCARDSDMVFRYGGEEFCVVLSNTGLAGATRLAERVRRTVESEPVDVASETLRLSVSVGVGTLDAGNSQTDLIARADAGLYRAKSEGRNRVAAGPAHDG